MPATTLEAFLPEGDLLLFSGAFLAGRLSVPLGGGGSTKFRDSGLSSRILVCSCNCISQYFDWGLKQHTDSIFNVDSLHAIS